jgi:hypothetical protein
MDPKHSTCRWALPFVALLILALLAACAPVTSLQPGGAPAASPAAPPMPEAEARQIASQGDCAKTGPLGTTAVFNDNTGTWWIDLNVQKAGCAPACVVRVSDKSSEVNWRCTGASPAPTAGPAMTLDQARQLAATNSDCQAAGTLQPGGTYNENSDTWWIDIAGNKPGCSPACVVNAGTSQVEVNWRCTGASPAPTAGPAMTLDQARQLAATNSDCQAAGTLQPGGTYNENSHTWWIDIAGNKPGCSPACVVNADTSQIEVNWRCTGAVAPTAAAKP